MNLSAAVLVSAVLAFAVLNVSIATREISYMCRFTVTEEFCLLGYNAM
jgi:hypothetical protein